MADIAVGELGGDNTGNARVLALVQVPDEGQYVVLQRTRGTSGRRRRPFLFPVASMLAGDDGGLPLGENRHA